MPDHSFQDREQVSLCEALDRILHKGAVLVGEVTISVANIDLIYLGLQIVLTSIENGRPADILTTDSWNEGQTLAEGAKR